MCLLCVGFELLFYCSFFLSNSPNVSTSGMPVEHSHSLGGAASSLAACFKESSLGSVLVFLTCVCGCCEKLCSPTKVFRYLPPEGHLFSLVTCRDFFGFSEALMITKDRGMSLLGCETIFPHTSFIQH